jgi:hypothetical protein
MRHQGRRGIRIERPRLALPHNQWSRRSSHGMRAGTARCADDSTMTTPTKWRDILPVNPAAELGEQIEARFKKVGGPPQ